MIRKTYTELLQFNTYEDRLSYLMLYGIVGEETLGANRYISQRFYKSHEWGVARRQAIIRDCGYDLGITSKPIHGDIYVHHMNPIRVGDLIHNIQVVLDLEYLICVSFDTHQLIHYAIEIPKELPIVVRCKNDTRLW